MALNVQSPAAVHVYISENSLIFRDEMAAVRQKTLETYKDYQQLYRDAVRNNTSGHGQLRRGLERIDAFLHSEGWPFSIIQMDLSWIYRSFGYDKAFEAAKTIALFQSPFGYGLQFGVSRSLFTVSRLAPYRLPRMIETIKSLARKERKGAASFAFGEEAKALSSLLRRTDN